MGIKVRRKVLPSELLRGGLMALYELAKKALGLLSGLGVFV